MKFHSSSTNIAVVVRNSTAYPQALRKKTPVARAGVVTWIPELPVQIGLMEASEKGHGHQMPKLTVKQWQEKLFEELDLSGLELWPPELAVATRSLLAKYHNVFLLESSEIGCTHSTKHVIKVTDDTPFKEWFRWIPLPLVEEVCTHVWEMLDSGAICPSQSMWCNAVVLVQKKDGGLCFCIVFWHLNVHTKKDSYPLPRMQEALESLVSAGYCSCLDLKSGFWQIKMDESSRQYTAFTVGNLGFFWMWPHDLWAVQCSSYFSMADAELPGRVESDILPYLSGWQSSSRILQRSIFTIYVLVLTDLQNTI